MLTVEWSTNCKDLSATINIRLLNVGDDDIEDRQDFVASVTLCQQREDNLLGHNAIKKCSEVCVW